MKKPRSSVPVDMPVSRRLSQVGGESIDVAKITIVQRIKLAYGYERSTWESRRNGRESQYLFPSAYDGRPAITVENEDGPVLSKAKPNIWLNLANWMRESKIKSPLSYLAYQFSELPFNAVRALEPHQLMSEEKLAAYNKAKIDFDEKIRLELVTQKSEAERHVAYNRHYGMDPITAWGNALSDVSLALSPLFRYCVSVGVDADLLDPVSERYHPAAILQFERYRWWYKRHWASLLPEDFSEFSKRVYPYLLTR